MCVRVCVCVLVKVSPVKHSGAFIWKLIVRVTMLSYNEAVGFVCCLHAWSGALELYSTTSAHLSW